MILINFSKFNSCFFLFWVSFFFGWRKATNQEPQLDEEEQLTKEEWQAINKLLSYQTDEDLSFPVEKVPPNAIRFVMDVSIGQAAARIINIDQTEVLCGRFEQLQVVTKLYPKSTRCGVTLKYCGLSSPEGSLAQVSVYEVIVNLRIQSCTPPNWFWYEKMPVDVTHLFYTNIKATSCFLFFIHWSLIRVVSGT